MSAPGTHTHFIPLKPGENKLIYGVVILRHSTQSLTAINDRLLDAVELLELRVEYWCVYVKNKRGAIAKVGFDVQIYAQLLNRTAECSNVVSIISL